MRERLADEVNLERAALAASSGLGSLGVFAVALLIFGLSAATGVNPIGGGEPTAVTYAGMYGLAPVIASLGAALPARFLGASWPLSLLAGAVVVGTFFWTAFGMESPSLAVTVFTLAPAVMTLVGSVGSGSDAKGILAVLVASATLLVVARLGLVPYPALAVGWIILPAAAGFFQFHEGQTS